MLALVRSSRFKRDSKKARKRGKDMRKLSGLIDLLIGGSALPPKYDDHKLAGNWKGHREAKMEPDWLLIYRISNGDLILVRTGTHSDLYKR